MKMVLAKMVSLDVLHCAALHRVQHDFLRLPPLLHRDYGIAKQGKWEPAK